MLAIAESTYAVTYVDRLLFDVMHVKYVKCENTDINEKCSICCDDMIDLCVKLINAM